MVKFLRRNWTRHSKLGRKSKLAWRRPTGRDNKMREKRRGYAPSVSIGYKNSDTLRGDLENKKPVMIRNTKDLLNIDKNKIGIIGRVGKKKKLDIAKKAKEMNVDIWNLNVKNFMKINLLERFPNQNLTKNLLEKGSQKEIELLEKDSKKESGKSSENKGNGGIKK